MAISPTTSSPASSGSAFNVDGIVSGLKTADIISKLMELQKAPIVQLQAQQTKITARDAAYQAISAAMSTLQTTAQSLMLSSSINAKVVSTSVPSIATATANANAINGTFTLNVVNLATATSAVSGGQLGTGADLTGTTAADASNMSVPLTAGTFTINGQPVTYVAGQSWDTLAASIATATGNAVTLVHTVGSNVVSLSSASPVQLGASTDSSNFLTAAHLIGAAQTGSAGSYIVQSNQLLGAAISGNPLSTARLNVGGGIAASGTFQLNGVSINWANTDSLDGILGRINASAAGVTAVYDPKLDKISLTNTNTGAQSISAVDTAGNFLTAVNLTTGAAGTAVQTYGKAAEYTTTQNGMPPVTQFSNSNSVIGAVQGVNLTLLSAGISSVTTTQDTTTATSNLQAFITQFNATVDLLDTDTKYDSSTNTGAVLSGDSTIRSLSDSLRGLVSQSALVPAGSAYATFRDIGVSTGAYGSAAGTTNHLVLDTGKLNAALTSNPQAVIQMLSGLTGTTSSTHNWIQSVTGQPFGQINPGTYNVTYDPLSGLSSVFTPTGGAPQKAVTSNIGPGGTNTTLIPGVSIIAANPLVASSDTITYTVASRGIMQTLTDYLNTARGANGMFANEKASAATDNASLTTQIAHANLLLDQRQQTLQAQFTAMEVALSQIQSQGASLLSSMGVSSSPSK